MILHHRTYTYVYITIWVCLKIVYPIVPNGFADHYPVFKWLAIIGNINPTFSDKPIYKVINDPFMETPIYIYITTYILLVLQRQGGQGGQGGFRAASARIAKMLATKEVDKGPNKV